MNIVFWFLIILSLILLWFLLGFLFKPIGRFISKIFNDTVDILNEKEKEKTNEK